MQEANEADMLMISPPNSSAWSGGSSSDAPPSPNLTSPLSVNHGCQEVDPTLTAPAPDLPPPPSAPPVPDPDNIAPGTSSPTAQQPACQESSATATADDEDVIYIDLTRRPGHGQKSSSPAAAASTEQPQAAAEPKTPVKLAKPSSQILQELLGRRAGCLRSPVPGIPCDLDRVEGIEDLQEVELVEDGEEDALPASSVPAPVSQQASGGVTDDSSQPQALQCADNAEAARASSGASCPSPVGHDQGLTSPPASPSQQQVYSIVQGIVSQAVQMVVSAPPLPSPSGSSAAADSNPAVTLQGLGPGQCLGLGTAEVDGDMKEALVSTTTVSAALAPEEGLGNKQCLDCNCVLEGQEALHQASPSPPGATGPPELAGTPGRDSELASQGSFTAAAALQLQAAPPSHMQGGISQGEETAPPQLSTLPLQHSTEPGDAEAAGSEQHSPTVRLGALSAFPVAGPAADRYASDPDSPSNAAADMRHVYNQASAWPTQAVELPSSWSSDPSSSNTTSDCTALHQEEEQDEEQEEEEEEVVWVAQPRSLLMASLRGAQRQSMTSLKEAALREEAALHLAAQAPGSKPGGPQTRPAGVKPPQLPAATKLLAHAQCASHKASSIGSSSNSSAHPSSGTPEQDAPEPSQQAPSSASPYTLVSPFASAGLKAILGKKGSMQSLKPQHSAPAPVLSRHHSGTSEVEPSLSHRKGPRLASRASAVDSAFSCEGGPFAALASKHSVSAGSTLQQPAPQDLPSVSLISTATNSAAGTTAQGRLSQSFAEEAPGCASNQPPPPLDNGVEDSIDNFLRDRCIICPRYPSDQVKKTTGTGHAQPVPPPLGPKARVEAGEEDEEGDEEEEAQEVDEDEFLAEDYDENDIEYSFDEEDDEDDIATTVMPVTRSEIASARMEIDKLKKELQEQQAVNSGLRGELRKFTTLASRLTAQLQAGKPAVILTTAAGPVTTGCVGAATSMAEAVTPSAPTAAPAPGVLAMTAGPPPTLPCASGSSVAADSSPAGAPEGLEPGQCIAVLQECQDSGAAAVTGGVEDELVGNGSQGEGQGEGHLNSSSRKLAGEEQALEQHSGNNTDVSACPPAAITAGSSTGKELGPLPTATQPVELQGAASEDSEASDSEGPPGAGYETPSAGTAGLTAAAGDAPSPAAASSAVLALTAAKVGKTRAGKGSLGARAVGASQGSSHSPQQMEAAAWKLERSMLLKHMADLEAKVKELEATQAGLSAVPTSPPPLDVSHSLHPHGPSAASTPTCTEAETDLVPAEQDGAQVRSPAPPPDASVVMPGAANDVIDTDLTKRPGHGQPAGSHAEPASSSADQSQAAADAKTHAANSLAARALLLSEREHFTQLLAQADLRALTAEQTLVHTLRQTQLQLDEVGMESAVLKGLVGTARSVVVGLRQQLSSALESAATQQRIAVETAEKLQQQVQHLQQEARQTACLQQVAAEQAEAARLDGEHAARALQAEVEQQLQTQLKEQADKIVFLEAELNRQQQPQAATAAPDATPTKPPEPPEVAAYQQLTNRCATLQAELHLQTAAAEQLAKHCVALEHQLAEQVAAADSQGQQMGGAHVSSPLQAMRLPGIMGQLASAEQKLAKLQSKYDATKRQLLQLQAAALGGSAVPPGGSEAACSNPGSPLQPSPSVVETSRLRLAALLQLVAATEAKLCKPSPLLGATSPKGPSPCASCGSVEAGSGGASAGSVLLEENALLLGLDALTRKLERRVRNVLLAALEAQQGQRQLLRQLVGTQARQGGSLSQPASVLAVSSFPSSGLTSQQMTPTAAPAPGVPASPAAAEDVFEPPVLHTPQGGASPASQSLSGMAGGWELGGQGLRVGAARQRAWEEQAELPQPRPRPTVRSEAQAEDTAARTSLPDPPSASLDPPASATAAAAQDARHQQGAEAGMASASSGSATLELRRQLASQAAVNAQLALQLAEMNRRLGPTPLTNHQPIATTYTTTSRQQGSQSSALQGPSPASTPAREAGAQPGHPAASSPLSPWSPWFHYPMAGPTAARPGPDLLHNSWAAPRTAGPTQAPPRHNNLLTSPLAQPNPHKALQYPGHTAGQPDPRPVPSSQPQQLRGGHTIRAKVTAGAGLHGAPYSMQFAVGGVPGARLALSPPPAWRPGADIAGAASPGRYASPAGSVYLGTRGGRVMAYTDIYKGLADLPDAQQ
ncbi:hypothetical protein V8C86DRAFT_1364888 [Haematococcus lacustris]